MILALFIHMMYSQPVRTFCERHIIDYDRSDPQTREWLEREEERKRNEEEEK